MSLGLPSTAPAAAARQFVVPPQADAALGEPRWAVRLLGAVEARSGHGEAAQTLSRWPSRAVAALLARLALAPERVHPREELVELLWPGVALDVGRNRLRQALSTLKTMLEPAGSGARPVLRADRLAIGVMPGALDSDVRQLERLTRAGQWHAVSELHRGELMPGFYDDWVVEERHRLAGLIERLQLANNGPDALLVRRADQAVTATTLASPPMPLAAHNTGSGSGLPSYWTRSFGDQQRAASLRARVLEQRLVTVHGPGGSGKTRLAVQAARSLLEAATGARPVAMQGDGATLPFERIAFVSLIDCNDAAQAIDAICLALHVDPGSDRRSRIVANLAGRRTLLVLDNLEQLVDTAGSELAYLLSAAPGLHLLVTSRRLLEIDGENAFELEGLALPADEPTLELAAGNPAVALFLDRARAARADFHLGPRNATAIAALVRLLSGMPLAIELAASRVRSLTPQELLQRLRDDAGTPTLDLLARGGQRPSADARHASMRHVVAWSWGQLDAAQVALMQSLSVLAAPARLEAIAALADGDTRATQRLLIDLHDASLIVRREGDDDVARYALLQPVREFAAERLSAVQARCARAGLREWLLGYAHSVVLEGGAAVDPAIGYEMAHVHAAVTSALADGAAREAVQLVTTLRPHWDNDNLPLSALTALEQLLPLLDSDDLRCEAHELLAFGRLQAGFLPQALAHARQALATAHDERRRCMALMRLSWAKLLCGQFSSDDEAALAEAWALAERGDDLFAKGHTLRGLATVACNVHLDFAAAERLLGQAQVVWDRAGNASLAQLTLLGRASMWAWMGRNEEALPVFMDGERTAQARGDWMLQHIAARQMGRVFLRVRNGPAAAAAFLRSLRVAWKHHLTLGIVHALLHLPEACVTRAKGAPLAPQLDTVGSAANLGAAARLQGFAVAQWHRLYGGINRIETRELCRARRMLRLHLGAARARALSAEGEAMALADAVALAQSLS